MKISFRIKLWPIAAVIAALGLTAGTVYAHEGRHVGEYEFTVGFIVEPTLEGFVNGVSLRVTKTGHAESEESGHTDESEEEEIPVEGLEDTLQVEVTHVPSGTSKVFELRPIFGNPGHYTADLIPTAPGQYRFRFFGTVEGMEVDEVFESGAGRFSDVESPGELQFPGKAPAAREIEGAVRGAQNTAEQAIDAATSARTLAIAGIVLGVLGIVSGAGFAVVVLRRR